MQANSESAKRFAAKPGKRAAIKQRRRVRSIQSHGLTPEQYAVMLAEQGGVCALCGNPPDPHASKRANRLHIDHGHATGRVRALLCAHCNLGLGRFRDDPAVLRKAAAYVEHHTAA